MNDMDEQCNCDICKSDIEGYVAAAFREGNGWTAEVSYKANSQPLCVIASLQTFDTETEARAASFGFVEGLKFRGELS